MWRSVIAPTSGTTVDFPSKHDVALKVSNFTSYPPKRLHVAFPNFGYHFRGRRQTRYSTKIKAGDQLPTLWEILQCGFECPQLHHSLIIFRRPQQFSRYEELRGPNLLSYPYARMTRIFGLRQRKLSPLPPEQSFSQPSLLTRRQRG